MRTPVMAGNWKMNGTSGEAVLLACELMERLASGVEAEVIVSPAYPSLIPAPIR